jgi:transposase
VECAFRELKHSLEVRLIYHWTDNRIRGQVMVCPLTFYLESFLFKALKEVVQDASYFEMMAGLSRLHAVKLTVNGKTFLARTQLKGGAYLAFKAAQLRIPRTAFAGRERKGVVVRFPFVA